MIGLLWLAWMLAGPVQAAEPLRTWSKSAGIHIGAAVDVEVLNKDPAYARLLAREFNVVTPENALKFSVVQPERGRFDFSQADALVAFAEAHGMQVHGHVLVWHGQLPEWLARGSFTRDELGAILRAHIQTLVGRYRGRIAWWDVAAEAVDEAGRPRETFWSRGLGPDYLERAFRWAHEADPNARLLYNDYGGEGAGARCLQHVAAGQVGRRTFICRFHLRPSLFTRPRVPHPPQNDTRDVGAGPSAVQWENG